MPVRFAGTAVIFLILAAFAWGMQQPMVAADEIGYLSIAQYLATGRIISMASAAYYYFGQGILLSPWFLVFSDPVNIYQAGVLQSCLATALAFPLFMVLGQRLGFVSGWKPVIAACLATLWPAYLYDAFLIWPESSFRLAFLSMLVALVVAWQERSRFWWWLTIVAAVICFALHPKGMALPAVAVIALLIGAAYGRMPNWCFSIGVLLAIAGWMGVRWANGIFLEALWTGNLNEVTRISRRIAMLSDLGGLGRFIAVASGQTWYALVTSAGLVLVGAWSLFRINRGLWLFACLAALTVIGASFIQMIEGSRIDHAIYGRYIAGVTPFFVWLGISSVLSGDIRKQPICWRFFVAIAFVVTVAPAAYLIIHGSLAGISYVNIPGALAARSVLEGYEAVAAILVGTTAISLILFALINVSAITGLLAIMIFVGWNGVAIMKHVYINQENRQSQAQVHAKILSRFDRPIEWHNTAWSDAVVFFAQFMSQVEFHPVNEPSGRPLIAASDNRFNEMIPVVALSGHSSFFVKESDLTTGVLLKEDTPTHPRELLIESQGWQGPENWGVWSKGHDSYVVIEVPEMAAPALQLLVHGLVGGSVSEQRVIVSVAGAGETTEWLVDRKKTVRTIPLRSGRMLIKFEFPDASSPKSLGMSEDLRVLALGVSQICLTTSARSCL